VNSIRWKRSNFVDKAQFWRLIKSSKKQSGNACMQQVRALTDILKGLPAQEIIEFQKLLVHYMNESYTTELWAAADLVNGGCGDDCFDYFRAWLI